MPRVIFAPAAIRDLERLRAFLRPKNPVAAKRAGEAIVQGVQALGAHPHMGRLVEELPEHTGNGSSISGIADICPLSH